MLFRPHRLLTLSAFRPSARNARARSGCINFILAVAPEKPAVLIIAGQERSGKTHLLHAAAHLAKTMPHLRSYSILSHHRLADEIERARQIYRDLPSLTRRLAAEDLLVIDDADELVHRRSTAVALLEILELRAATGKRTLLSATLDATPATAMPLADFLNQQWAIRLD